MQSGSVIRSRQEPHNVIENVFTRVMMTHKRRIPRCGIDVWEEAKGFVFII